MKFWTGLLLFLGLLLVAQPSVAYDTDGHFYTVYVIARDSGFTPPEALEIATMVEYTDWDVRTDAVQWPYPFGPGNEQRRLYHFPCDSAHSAAWTQQNSAWAKHNVNMSLKANNLTKLGIAIHVYQDSYSHETYGQVKGHLFADPTVHYPDYPFRWVDKYVNMTNFIYTIMKQYRTNNGLEISERKLIDTFKDAAAFAPPDWEKHPGGWRQKSNDDYAKFNLQPRCDWWTKKIAETYKSETVPVYQTPSQSILAEFTKIVAAYKLPDKEAECDKSEWARKDAAVAAALAAVTAPPLVLAAATAADEAEIARILEMPIKWGARRLVTKAPQAGSDSRVRARLTNEAALGVILDSTDLIENPGFIAYVVNYWDWTTVDVASQFELRLASPNFRVRILCASLLSSAPVLSELTAERLRAVYKTAADSNLSAADRSYILDLIPSDPERISLYAPNAVAILAGLMQYPDTATGAAAKLYRVGVDTSRLAQAGPLDAIRMDAFNALQGQDAQSAADGVRYWIIRSYEDFDGAVSNSAADVGRIAGLLKIWIWADIIGDVEALRAAAVAISTYDTQDATPKSLIDALQTSLLRAELTADSTLIDITLDIRNALQAVTGGK
ncbi:MAG: DUF6765 family protein [Syntrophales bacterium]